MYHYRPETYSRDRSEFWRSLEITGDHWRSLEIAGDHWRSLERSTHPVLTVVTGSNEVSDYSMTSVTSRRCHAQEISQKILVR
eukprot:957658-Amorphochlora_amoeboformis.AAC.1